MELSTRPSQTCRTCGETKPIDQFDIRADRGKRKTQCKICRRKYQNERHARLHPRQHRPARVAGTTEPLKCTRCERLKACTEFPPIRRGEAELQPWCRACFAEANREHYAQNRRSEVARLRQNVDATRRANHLAIMAYLLKHPCVDCGEPDPIVLDFDHISGKRANVSELANSGATWPRVEEEIARCEVRCANCHRIRTGQRKAIDAGPLQFEIFWSDLILEPSSIAASSEVRTCRKCGLARSLSEFAFRSVRLGTRRWVCRTCHSAYHRAWYERSRQIHLARVRTSRKRSKARAARIDGIRRRVWQYLMEHGCVDCGNSDTHVLDFDHLRDKTKEVGALARSGASWARVTEEIAKCAVRCANCHRKRTAREVGAYRLEMSAERGG